MEQVFNFIDTYSYIFIIFFYLLLLFPVVFGLINGMTKGFKKGLWNFIFKAAFYLVFIFTLELVTRTIYGSPMFGLANKLYEMLLHESTSTTLTLQEFFRLFFKSYAQNFAQAQSLDLDSPYVLDKILN